MIDWIESCNPDIYEFDLVSNYPRRVFSAEHREATLVDLGLDQSATLFTKEQE